MCDKKQEHLVVCSLTMKHTRVVSTECTPGFACRAFSDTTLVCFIVNEHTTKCSRYNHNKQTENILNTFGNALEQYP